MHHHTVLLLGKNPREGTVEALGSGFIVGGADSSIHIVTAAHVLSEGRYFPGARERGGKRPAFDGLLSAQETQQEATEDLSKLIGRELITAVVASDTGPSYELVITGCTIGLDIRALDIAYLEAIFPGAKDSAIDITGMPMDLDPITPGEIVGVAGFSEGAIPWKATISEFEAAVGAWRESLTVRVGLVAEVTTLGEGARGGRPLIRLNIPTLGNMSGGPLFRVRNPRPIPRVHGVAHTWMHTAIGVISRGNPGGSLLAYSHSAEGETWATPINALRTLKLPYRGELLSFEEQLDRQMIVDYSQIAENSKRMPPEVDDGGITLARLSKSGDKVVERKKT